MPGNRQLIIKLRVDGTVEAETKNIHGDACVPFAAILEDLCDAEAITSEYTQDYYVSQQATDEVTKDELRDNA